MTLFPYSIIYFKPKSKTQGSLNKEHYQGILWEAKPKFNFLKGNLEPDILEQFLLSEKYGLLVYTKIRMKENKNHSIVATRFGPIKNKD